jgi:hypothetical protein
MKSPKHPKWNGPGVLFRDKVCCDHGGGVIRMISAGVRVADGTAHGRVIRKMDLCRECWKRLAPRFAEADRFAALANSKSA